MAVKKKTWAEKRADEDHVHKQTENEGGESNEPAEQVVEIDEDGTVHDAAADPDEAFSGTDSEGREYEPPIGSDADLSIDPVKSPRKPRTQREKIGFRGHVARISAVCTILGAHTNLTGNIDLTIDALAELIKAAPTFADSIDLIDEPRTRQLYNQACQMLIAGGKMDKESGKLARKPKTGSGRSAGIDVAARDAEDQAAALAAYEASLRKPETGGEDSEYGVGEPGDEYGNENGGPAHE